MPFEAELSFQVGDRLGDHRLSPPEPAPGSGETAFVHGGHKRAELAQRHPLNHPSSLSIIPVDSYRLINSMQGISASGIHPLSIRYYSIESIEVPSRRWLELGWRSLRVVQPK